MLCQASCGVSAYCAEDVVMILIYYQSKSEGSIVLNIDEQKLIEIARAAAAAILDVYTQDFEVQSKTDASPLTQADLAAHEVIVSGLQALTPERPIISEESEPPGFSVRSSWSVYWLVDPLDGTKEFVNRNGEFTVNIALIRDGQPAWGIVVLPVHDRIYIGDVAAGLARCIDQDGEHAIKGRQMQLHRAGYDIVASRSHGSQRSENYLDELGRRLGPLNRKAVGSSLKLCALADGEADCYPRLGPTSEWDIGAAHAVLKAAGGEVYTFDRTPLAYNSKESLLNPEFVAVADAAFDWWSVLPAQPSPDEE